MKFNTSHKFTKVEEEDKTDVKTEENYQPRNRLYQ